MKSSSLDDEQHRFSGNWYMAKKVATNVIFAVFLKYGSYVWKIVTFSIESSNINNIVELKKMQILTGPSEFLNWNGTSFRTWEF